MTRVLLVDDDLDVLESLEMVLAPRYEVRMALDGRRALVVLDTERVDVAVVDLIMPGMDGEMLVAAMRARGIGVPVIIASATPELAERARGLGVFAWLAKPFTMEALEACLTAALASGGGGPPPNEGPGAATEPDGDPHDHRAHGSAHALGRRSARRARASGRRSRRRRIVGACRCRPTAESARPPAAWWWSTTSTEAR